MKLEVKNVKTWTGVEGIGFQASLYADGKRIAIVTDDAWGAEYRYDVRDAEKFTEVLAYVKTLPMLEWHGIKLEPSIDSLMDDLVNKYEEDKQWKKLCKTKIVLITPDCDKGQYRLVNVPPTPALIAQVKEKYPNAEIVNERF